MAQRRRMTTWDGAAWEGRALYPFAPIIVDVLPESPWVEAFGADVRIPPGVQLVPEGGSPGALTCRVVDPVWPPGLRVVVPLDLVGRTVTAGPAGRVRPVDLTVCRHRDDPPSCPRCFLGAAQRIAAAARVEWDTDAP